MFKTLSLFGLADLDYESLPELLQTNLFVPCGASNAVQTGWSPVRDMLTHVAMENNARHLLLKFTIEKKTIPAAGLKALVAAKCLEVEAMQKYAPGKKQKAEIKERLVDELLPSIIPVRKHYRVWIDLPRQLLAIEASQANVVDAVLSALIKADVEFTTLDVDAQKHMTEWVRDEGSWVEDFAELLLPGDKGTIVQYKNAQLYDNEELAGQLLQGMKVHKLHISPTKHVSFILNSNMQFSKIAMDVKPEKVEGVDKFDADFLLMIGNVGEAIDELMAEMRVDAE